MPDPRAALTGAATHRQHTVRHVPARGAIEIGAKAEAEAARAKIARALSIFLIPAATRFRFEIVETIFTKWNFQFNTSKTLNRRYTGS